MSYSEAKGFLSLLVVCIVVLTVIFFPKIIIRSKQVVDPGDIKKLDSIVAILESAQSKVAAIELFHFDPNLVSADSLMLIGFPEKIADRLVNYRSKGGRFGIKQDVKKIYGVSEELYISIEPYITLSENKSTSDSVKSGIDLNKVTEVQLESISGIGDILAGRIIKYREILGGFISENQLDEVYQLDGEALEAVKNRGFVTLDYAPIKLKINQATTEELMRHPYISRTLAEDIVRFREINGSIESEKLLASFKSVDKGNFEKLISYLDFQ